MITKTDNPKIPDGFVLNKKNTPVKPEPVPSLDNMWRDFFFIDKYKLPHWWYVNVNSEKLFIVKKLPKKDGGKYFQQGSYASGKYHKENLWTKVSDFKLPLYRLDELVKTDKETILIVEGENTCEVAQKLLPDIFVTTYSSGVTNYLKSDWSVLKGFKDKNIVAWPDSEDKKTGIKHFTNLCLFLKDEYNIEAKLVDVPTYSEIASLLKGDFQKSSWDLADTIPESIDVKELIKAATPPEPEPDLPFSNIEDYLYNYIYIRNLGNRYYDKEKRKITTQEEINNLFLRAKGRGSFTSGKAHEWFHTRNIPFVDGTTFYPSDKEIIERRDQKLINLYTPPKFKPLGRVPGIEDIKWFTEHLRYLCSYNEESYHILLNTIACAVQKPYENRTWALLLHSGQGNGKQIFFEVLSRLVGQRNCYFLKLSQLYSKFNSYLTSANNLFVKEANSKGSEDNQSIASLKELITEDIHTVEFKGKDFLQHECHYNVYLSSNDSQPIKVERDDRRICFISCDQQPKDRHYYTDIYENKLKDSNKINEVYTYFKEVHNIPEEFNLKYAPHTIFKDSIIEDSQTSYEYELGRLLDNKILESFYWDIVNVDKIYEDLSYWRIDDTRAYKNPFMDKEITKKQIRNFLKSRGAVKYKHYAVPQYGDTFSDLHDRGQYWIVRNIDQWRSASIQELRDHFNDPLINLRKAKDKKNHQDILTTGYKGDSEREQGNAIYDRLIQEELYKNNPLFNTKRKEQS
jgi:hypothetical protein